MLNRRDVLSSLATLPLFSLDKSIDNPPKADSIDTNYSLCDILVLAREQNKGFARKQWGQISTSISMLGHPTVFECQRRTIHHGMDNQLVYKTITYGGKSGWEIWTTQLFYTPSIADLLATDWELVEDTEYHFIPKKIDRTVDKDENLIILGDVRI